MSNNINIKEYLAQLGDFETNQQNRIKKYLEEQCTKDEALKTLYRPEKIADCYNFIKDVVRQKSSGDAVVEDAIVYKMARDYYLEILPKYAESGPEIKKPKKAASKKEKEPEFEEATVDMNKADISDVTEDMSKDIEAAEVKPAEEKLEITNIETAEDNVEAADDNVVRDEYGFEVFGEEAEGPKDEPSHQEAKNKKAAEAVREAKPVTADEETQYDENGNGLLFTF